VWDMSGLSWFNLLNINWFRGQTPCGETTNRSATPKKIPVHRSPTWSR
jgi:hypothetical protein